MEVKVKRKSAAASAFESFGSFVVKKYPPARMPFECLKKVLPQKAKWTQRTALGNKRFNSAEYNLRYDDSRSEKLF